MTVSSFDLIYIISLILLTAGIVWLLSNRRHLTLKISELERVTAEKEALFSENITLKGQIQSLEAKLEASKEQKRSEEQMVSYIQQTLIPQLQASSHKSLQDNNKMFMDLAGEFFKRNHEESKAELDRKQATLIHSLQPLQEAVKDMNTKANTLQEKQTAAYTQVREQIENLLKAQDSLKDQTVRLSDALRKPHIRGRWGEMTLRRVLESAGMLRNCDFIEQNTFSDENQRQLRPDVVVRLPDNSLSGGRRQSSL